MFNDYGAKMLQPYLVTWGIPYVLYDGAKKQEAEDRFREDDRIKVFLSSDQGSDSINLEKGMSVINYDLPWNYSTLIQRVNRVSRLTSEFNHVFYYNLIVANTIEERKLKLLNSKRAYEESIDKPLNEQTDYLTESLADLRYLLLGE
jgi:SNF2 family DNA or RNA helicase